MALRACVVAVVGLSVCADPVIGAPIPVVNPSFESPALAPADFTLAPPSTVPGWTQTSSGSGGLFYPTVPSWGYTAAYGNQVLYCNETAFQQTVAATVVASRTYTLRVTIVQRPLYNNTYTVQLIAGSTVVAQDANSHSPPNGGFEDTTLIYTAPASGPTIGQPLTIRLSGTTQTNFDNVRLEDSTPAQCPGDITGDGITNSADFNVLASHFGQSVPPGTQGDLTGDGLVNSADFNVLASNFGCGG